jgi:RIO-like serine/threonine protein kinase
MSYSGGNMVHWLRNPLDPDEVKVLARMKAGTHPWASKRFVEAALISRECVEPDYETKSYTLTAKGLDALDYHAEDSP